MKTAELRDLSMDELTARGKDLQEELFNLRFQHGTNQLENPMRLRLTKREIARVKSIIVEKVRKSAKNES